MKLRNNDWITFEASIMHHFSALFYVFDNHVSGAHMDSALKPSEWINFHAVVLQVDCHS